jgi:hypothetical protein
MSPSAWLEAARRDAQARGLTGTVPVLEAMSRMMQVLRSAPWNDRAAPPADDAEATTDGSR